MSFTGPLADRIEIRELMETYAHGVMNRDPDIWGAVWAEDAYWALPEYPDLGGYYGKAAIVAGWTESMQHYGLDNCTRPMIYVMTPGAINVSGDHATAVAYTSEIYDDPATGKRVHARGRYDDQLQKSDGHWLFTRREYRITHAE
jgi:ketosteroid isomerase-like protein